MLRRWPHPSVTLQRIQTILAWAISSGTHIAHADIDCGALSGIRVVMSSRLSVRELLVVSRLSFPGVGSERGVVTREVGVTWLPATRGGVAPGIIVTAVAWVGSRRGEISRVVRVTRLSPPTRGEVPDGAVVTIADLCVLVRGVPRVALPHVAERVSR